MIILNPTKTISKTYSKKLIDMFPTIFQDKESIDNYIGDVFKKQTRYGEVKQIQLLYKSEDVKRIVFPLKENYSKNTFIKHRRERNSKKFSDKPFILLKEEAGYLLSLDVIMKGYLIELSSSNIFNKKPSLISSFKSSSSQIVFYKDSRHIDDSLITSYFNAYISLPNGSWHMYLPFKSNISELAFNKLNKLDQQ